MQLSSGPVSLRTLLVSASVGLVCLGSLHASSPTFWHTSTLADLLKGEVVENVSVDSDGRLVLGPATDLVAEATTPFLWALARDGAGRLLVGAGPDGKVLRIGADGKTETAFDVAEQHVYALVAERGGSFVAASSPDGKVYRVAPDGTSSVVADPDDKYIWALAAAPDGTLFVGTGEKAVVYRVPPGVAPSPVYRAKASNVTALAVESTGQLLVGTENPGQVVRVDSRGRAFVVLDSPYREIHALRFDAQGTLFVVALNPSDAQEAPAQPKTTPAPTTGQPTPVVSTEITVTAVGDVAMPITTGGGTTVGAQTRGKNRGAVYRITRDGLWDVVWDSTEDTPYDVAFEPGGTLLVATGPKGKIFRCQPNSPRVTLVTRTAAQQVTTFARSVENALLFATSNPGKVFQLSTAPTLRGIYQSDVRDASNVATWGAIRWRAATPEGASVEVSTRSGNTSRPDDTWSDWSAPYRNNEGEQIASPPARYLQWRVALAGRAATPVVTSVTVAYLPRNVRPVVESITLHPPGTVFLRPYPTGEQDVAGFDSESSDGRQSGRAGQAAPTPGAAPALGRRTYEKGLQTFIWKARDENDDRLQYDVYYRKEGDSAWRLLRRAFSDALLTWDTTSVPDGTYTIRVVAGDWPSNSPATALEGELESTAFDVDNTPPAIEFGTTRTEGTRTIVRFTVRDRQSPVHRVEYSLDANRWRVVHPIDGIADSRIEEFEVVIDGSPTAQPIVRATDSLANVATGVVGARP